MRCKRYPDKVLVNIEGMSILELKLVLYAAMKDCAYSCGEPRCEIGCDLLTATLAARVK